MIFNLSKKVIIWVLIAALVVTGITLGLVFGLKSSPKIRAAIVSNGNGCADIGKTMLDDGGSAVDAAIATLLCEGVMLPHSMGIGGGFVATVYTRSERKVETLIARESAPLAASEDMFVNQNITGPLAAAVPGEILGYWALHQKYGKLPWDVLFKPTINLARMGHTVSIYLHNAMKQYEQRIINEPSMAEVFVNPHTGLVWETGDIITRPKLADTLEIIAKEGKSAIYDGGDIGKKLVQDVQSLGGIITEDDLKQYTVQWDPPVVVNISSKYTMYTTPLPSSGAVLAFILNLLSAYDHKDEYLYWHRVVESFKHAYGQRTKLGDMHFEPDVEAVFKNLTDPVFAAEIRKMIIQDRTFQDFEYYGAEFHNEEDHGTANMGVVDLNGDAVTITSTINTYFGCKIRSSQTGIILNDEMDDFSTPGTVNYYGIPASPANFIKPKKRPMSSMSPSIIVDKKGDVRMLVGAAGGSMITTSVAQTIIRYLILNEDINESITAKRIHHQLAPMLLQHENGVDEHLLTYLGQKGHLLSDGSAGSFSAVTTIGVRDGSPIPVYDSRRVGSVAVAYSRNKMVH